MIYSSLISYSSEAKCSLIRTDLIDHGLIYWLFWPLFYQWSTCSTCVSTEQDLLPYPDADSWSLPNQADGHQSKPSGNSWESELVLWLLWLRLDSFCRADWCSYLGECSQSWHCAPRETAALPSCNRCPLLRPLLLAGWGELWFPFYPFAANSSSFFTISCSVTFFGWQMDLRELMLTLRLRAADSSPCSKNRSRLRFYQNSFLFYFK